MGEPNVAIGESELNQIGEYVQSHLASWMERLGVRLQPDAVTNTQLLERVIQVEEELKAQREIMVTKFEASDNRIGDLMKMMDDRFADVRHGIGTVKWFVVTSFLVIGTAISLVSILQ